MSKKDGVNDDLNETVKRMSEALSYLKKKEILETFNKKSDDKNSQYSLGICYLNGFGVPKDPKKAFDFFLKSANNGLCIAQYQVATCYESGTGCTKDQAKAVEMFMKAAVQNNYISIFKMGFFL